MKWTHIMDAQPINDSTIIQLDAPYEDNTTYKDDWNQHYAIGLVRFQRFGEWEEYMAWCKDNKCFPNYYWIYAKDFPFPPKRVSQ